MAPHDERKTNMVDRRSDPEDVHIFLFRFKEVKHTVEVSAGGVYEAVAQPLRIFRDNEWAEDIGHGQTPITVKVKNPEIEHMVRVRDFERWVEASPR
jgi:hypothetical protein